MASGGCVDCACLLLLVGGGVSLLTFCCDNEESGKGPSVVVRCSARYNTGICSCVAQAKICNKK